MNRSERCLHWYSDTARLMLYRVLTFGYCPPTEVQGNPTLKTHLLSVSVFIGRSSWNLDWKNGAPAPRSEKGNKANLLYLPGNDLFYWLESEHNPDPAIHVLSSPSIGKRSIDQCPKESKKKNKWFSKRREIDKKATGRGTWSGILRGGWPSVKNLTH